MGKQRAGRTEVGAHEHWEATTKQGSAQVCSETYPLPQLIRDMQERTTAILPGL